MFVQSFNSLYIFACYHFVIYVVLNSSSIRLNGVFWRFYTWRRGAIQTSGKISAEVSNQGGHGDTASEYKDTWGHITSTQ